MSEDKQPEVKFLAIGDKVKESPVGPGTVTDITPAGYAVVDHVAVGWLVREDGLRYNPRGIGALPSDLTTVAENARQGIDPSTFNPADPVDPPKHPYPADAAPQQNAPAPVTAPAEAPTPAPAAPESAVLAPEASPAAPAEPASAPAEPPAAAPASVEPPQALPRGRRVPRTPIPSKDE